eukprot:1002346-Amphidinium_carterae.1
MAAPGQNRVSSAVACQKEPLRHAAKRRGVLFSALSLALLKALQSAAILHNVLDNSGCNQGAKRGSSMECPTSLLRQTELLQARPLSFDIKTRG